MNPTTANWRGHRLLVGTVILLMAVGLSQALMTSRIFAAPKSAAYLSNNVTGGQATVVNWEQICTTTLAANRAAGLTGRTLVNASAYVDNVWPSRQGDPNNNSTNVPAGTTQMAMQVNEMNFLCAIVTMPAAFSISPLPGSKVTNGNYPNERGPVPDLPTYSPNAASRYEHNTHMDSVQVLSVGGGTAYGTGPNCSSPTRSANFPSNTITSFVRDNSSRYWPANTAPFIYCPASPLTPGQHTILIQVNFREIDTYHNYGTLPGAVNRCQFANGSSHNVAYQDFRNCHEKFARMRFTFNVDSPQFDCTSANVSSAPARLEPGVSGATLTFGFPANAPVNEPISYNIFRSTGGAPVASGTTTLRAGQRTVSVALPTLNVADTYSVQWTMNGGACPSGSVNVVVLPFFKVYNSGVEVGGNFPPGSCNAGGTLAGWYNNNGNNFGSSVQLNDIALVKVVGVAGAFNSGPAPPTGLTFANTGPGVVINTDDTSPSLGGSFDPGGNGYCFDLPKSPGGTVPPSLPAGNVSAIASGAYSASNLRLSGGSVNGNVSIFVTGDVYIAKDPSSAGITYTGSGGGSWTVGNIPSFVLVATGNIYVDANITELDGVYVANGGQIYTCSQLSGNTAVPVAASDMFGTCSKQLTVYGSFIANQVNLMRTYGSLHDDRANASCTTPGGIVGKAVTQASCAGEQFIFSPEIYLGTPQVDNPNSRNIRYDSIISLPPVL